MSNMRDIIIVPQETSFEYELEEGVAEYICKGSNYEMTWDFRKFPRQDVKITISKTHIRIFARSESGEELNEFDEEILIPEGVMREAITCQMNSKGILKLLAPLHPSVIEKQNQSMTKIVSDTQTTTKKTSASDSSVQKTSESEKFESTAQKISEPSSHDQKTKTNEEDESAESGKWTVAKGKSNKAAKKPAIVSEPEKEEELDINITPKKLNFECDIDLIQDKPEFRVTSTKTMRVYINCSKFKSEEVKVKLMKNTVVRVEAKQESRWGSRSFLKDIAIPNFVAPEDIEYSFNDKGVLRLVAETKESREFGLIQPNHVNFVCSAAEKTNASQPTLTFFDLDSKSVQVFVNTSQFSPQDIRIKKIGLKIFIELKHGGNLEERKETFDREISIPEDVDDSSLDCAINSSGILRFVANKY